MNLLVDKICVEYEGQLRSGESTDIGSLLGRVEPPLRAELLTELLVLRIEYDGDKTLEADCLQAYPDYQNAVRTAFRKQSNLLLRPLGPGDTVGRYRVTEVLGSGSFGWVYHGWDEELDRDVALKVPRLSSSATDAVVKAFVREARSLAGLRHRNILSIYDIVRDARGWPVMVLEFLDGESIDIRCVDSGESAIGYLAQVARGLDKAHQHGVVHRDLKPQNIVIDQDDRAVLVDFGLSLQHESQKQHAGESAGTLKYMSPEQVRGEAHWMDGRADIWALGAVLYKLSCGRDAFSGGSSEEIATAILTQPLRPLRQIAPHLSPELERICDRCLQKSPEDRYSTAADLARDLEALRNSRPRYLVGLLGAVAVLVVSSVAWFVSRPEGGAEPGEPTPSPVAVGQRLSSDVASPEGVPPKSDVLFDFENAVEPWHPYTLAKLRLCNDAAEGSRAVEVLDREDYHDGICVSLLDRLRNDSIYWFSARAKSLGGAFQVQLQLELSDDKHPKPYFPCVAFKTINNDWSQLSGGWRFNTELESLRLIVRNNGEGDHPAFRLDAVSVTKLAQVPDSERIVNGGFGTQCGRWRPDGGRAQLTREKYPGNGWGLKVSRRNEKASGVKQAFRGKPGQFYLCRARVRAGAEPIELKLQMKHVVGEHEAKYGLQRTKDCVADEWTLLEEIYYSDPSSEGPIAFEFGVYSIYSAADFVVDDLSVTELRVVGPVR